MKKHSSQLDPTVQKQLQSIAERWCYIFRNLYTFVSIPSDASEFEPIFEIARTGELDKNELKRYLSTMVTEYDKLVIGEYNRELGRKEGREELIKALVTSGMSPEEIAQRIAMEPDEIRKILNK